MDLVDNRHIAMLYLDANPPQECDCPEAEMSEPLKCGPCKKCVKRTQEMVLGSKYDKLMSINNTSNTVGGGKFSSTQTRQMFTIISVETSRKRRFQLPSDKVGSEKRSTLTNLHQGEPCTYISNSKTIEGQ